MPRAPALERRILPVFRAEESEGTIFAAIPAADRLLLLAAIGAFRENLGFEPDNERSNMFDKTTNEPENCDLHGGGKSVLGGFSMRPRIAPDEGAPGREFRLSCRDNLARPLGSRQTSIVRFPKIWETQ